MSDKTWKAVERQVARLLGGSRVPVSGRQRGFAPDILHETLSLEVKHRKDIPDWLLDAMNQAELSKRDDQIPTVVLHKKGMKFENSLTVVRLSSMMGLLEKIRTLEERISDMRNGG